VSRAAPVSGVHFECVRDFALLTGQHPPIATARYARLRGDPAAAENARGDAA
jgi:hypothetical protein